MFFISWLIINQHATINTPPKKPTASLIIRPVLFKSTNPSTGQISLKPFSNVFKACIELTMQAHRRTDNNEAHQLRVIMKPTLLLDIPQ